MRPFLLNGMWLAAIAATASLVVYGQALPSWTLKYPRYWELPLKGWISDLMKWLVNDATFGLFTFKELTRSISWLLDWPLQLATSLLSSGFLHGQGSKAVEILPPLSWIAVTTLAVLIAHFAGGRKLALLIGGCFLYLAVFGQWDSAMITLSSIAIAVPFGVAGGLLLGIAGPPLAAVRAAAYAAARSNADRAHLRLSRARSLSVRLRDGSGDDRHHNLRPCPPWCESPCWRCARYRARSSNAGAWPAVRTRQMLWRVMLPSSLPSLMVGVNQVIMLSLNMVIIASMIGPGGLGYDVLTSLKRLDIGGGLEAGVAIVVLAIALDRLSQAFARRPPPEHYSEQPHGLSGSPSQPCHRARRDPADRCCGASATRAAALPAALELTTGPYWDALVSYLNINFFDQFEAVKTFLLIYLLIPVKRFLLGLPWPLGDRSAGAGRLEARRVATGVAGLPAGALHRGDGILGQGHDHRLPLRHLGSDCGPCRHTHRNRGPENERVGRIVQVAIDTLQTLPAFVYLIPVVMLFRVGDFSAMIAVIAYAIAPVIRYTAHGIRQIPPELIEAGVATGCNRIQLLRKIKLKLALPEIMLGINQTIMLALSMLVITALVGTRDLGQEVYIALTKADTGRGVVAGLCVASIAIIADRLIASWATQRKRELGLS